MQKIDLKYVNGNSMKINASNVLDQYFTKELVAKNLYEKAKNIIAKYEKNVNEFIGLTQVQEMEFFLNFYPKTSA